MPLLPDGGPETYDLCGDHADRTRPPHGWMLHDERPDEVPVDAPDSAELGSPQTVAVLAAALRGEPDSDAATDPAPDAVDVGALDAIVDEPFDAPQVDLYGTADEADPTDDDRTATVPADALTELSALSGQPQPEADEDDTSVIEQVPARTVPGAHRPA